MYICVSVCVGMCVDFSVEIGSYSVNCSIDLKEIKSLNFYQVSTNSHITKFRAGDYLIYFTDESSKHHLVNSV